MKKALSVLTVVLMAASASAAAAPDSKRLALAKEYIADEQWARAIDELRAAAADPRDPNRDEALFWLAHSEYQVGDHAEAVQTIARLERLFVKSRWTRPARSLRVEIAQRLRRDDVLWVLAAPPAMPAAPPRAVPPEPMRRGALPPPASAPQPPTPLPPPPDVLPGDAAPFVRPAATPHPSRIRGARPAPPPRPARGGDVAMPFEGLMPAEPYAVDPEVRIQALASLLDTHSDRVIPLLREIALDNRNPAEARRAVFALAQSPRSDARNTVVEAARRGPEVVRIAAIREMGRFQDQAFASALAAIARSESDPAVRDTAIVTLGRSGARVQLRSLYAQLPQSSRPAVLTGLFNAKDDDELIRIASSERDPRLRSRARQHLRLLGTQKAIKYLIENP